MGNAFSPASTGLRNVSQRASNNETMAEAQDSLRTDNNEEEFHEAADNLPIIDRNEEMNEFRKQLALKREKRHALIASHKEEKENLKKTVEMERIAKQELIEQNVLLLELLVKNNIAIPKEIPKYDADILSTFENMKVEFKSLQESNKRLRQGLAESNLSLQTANADIANLNEHNIELDKQVKALKDVITVSKTMINLREQQLNDLKGKLSIIEKSLADRESNLLSADLRQEYERQLQNIRTLRGLYEERARLAEVTRLNLLRELEEQKRMTLAEVNKCIEYTAKIEELQNKVIGLQEAIEHKTSRLNAITEESRGLKAEMSAVNELFSQVLLGSNSKYDWDQLVHRLEENHGILAYMVEKNGETEYSSALPKLLLELMNQVDEIDTTKDITRKSNETQLTEESSNVNATAEEIVENLPKVWRVLTELLSHQSVTDSDGEEKVKSCYKTVETSAGSVLVPSVSQTYIRLKDLILEKLALIKEVNKMKQLNGHLESRLEEQERRLCSVTTELSKTWHVVSRLRRHHNQLHTHEKILKYELQQKRKLLNELKEELEYCREKWEKAREKNTQSERDWKKLRAEFSSRKNKSVSPSFNNSGESGYSDEKQSEDSSESNDESEYVSGRTLKLRKRIVKSVENILDSSTDINPVAEREDPISDMVDVADLPLDGHEIEDYHERSEMCTSIANESEEISESCEQIEDETVDCNELLQEARVDKNVKEYNIARCNLETSEHRSTSNGDLTGIEASGPSSRHDENTTLIDPATILMNIKLQNERLARKDSRLDNLEALGKDLINKVKATNQTSISVNKTLDSMLQSPPISTQNIHTDIIKDLSPSTSGDNTDGNNDRSIPCSPSQIIENIRKQNERLTKRDERLKNLESGCSEVVNHISNILTQGKEIEERLDNIHDDQASGNYNNENKIDQEHIANNNGSIENIKAQEALEGIPKIHSDVNMESDNTLEVNDVDESNSTHTNKTDYDNCDSTEASTSRVTHEERFAARDIRLKRLEEQTKSLVSKVNKTKTKGVKINYKLEELHNIYGSENSRAGTPSDEGDTDSQNTDENSEKN